MAKSKKPRGLIRAKLPDKPPHHHAKVGRSGTVASVNALFDIDEIIDGLKFWAGRNAYAGFRLKNSNEEIRKDGKFYYSGTAVFGRNVDFYSNQKVEVNFEIKKASKVQVEGPDGNIRNLMKGQIGFSTNTGLDLDYNNIFRGSRGISGFLHHIFFEYIYRRTFEEHKLDMGINTGKIHSLLKGQVNSFKKYKEV